MSGAALLLLGIGSVLALEGLVLALAPARIDRLIERLRGLDPEHRRGLGLAALAAGVALIWLAERMAG
ncbi:MAG: DUF2065 family protein [Pseudomonadota bacterium]